MSRYSEVEYGSYRYPSHAVGIGWIIAILSLILIPAGMISSISKTAGASTPLIEVSTNTMIAADLCCNVIIRVGRAYNCISMAKLELTDPNFSFYSSKIDLEYYETKFSQ